MADQGSSGIPSVPKAPFIIGDILITGIAATVLFQDFPSLGPTTLLACVFAMIAGAALLVFPYALDYKTLRLLARLEANQVGLNVADALGRAETILARIEELERKRDASAILTEKLPDLIRERLDRLVNETAAQSDRTFQNLVESAAPKLANQLLPQFKTLQNELTSIAEKTWSSIESIKAQTPPPTPAPPDSQSEANQPPSHAGDMSRPQSPANAGPKWKDEGGSTTPTPSSRPRNTRLRVTAFVGIANKIHLRGNGGGLDPDSGIILQMTGIGEWEWSEKLTDTISCEIWLNDDTPALENPITLNPGDNLTIQPSFHAG